MRGSVNKLSRGTARKKVCMLRDDSTSPKTIIYIYFGQVGIEEDDTLLFYEPLVYGYSLDIRQWGKFFVQDLEPADWDINMFEDLVLAKPQKTLLKSLVLSHSSAPDEEAQEKPSKGKENISSQSALPDSRDLTEAKGKGLVVVLHGPPGTGKTMTAGMPPVGK
jgi:hypothetical protein